jgi:hypothetical protein
MDWKTLLNAGRRPNNQRSRETTGPLLKRGQRVAAQERSSLATPVLRREMRIAPAMFWYSRGGVSQSIGAASAAVFIDKLAGRRILIVQATAEELRDKIHRDCSAGSRR